MFSGKKVLVDLRDNSLMKTMADRFGEDVNNFMYDMTSFRVHQTEAVGMSVRPFQWRVFASNIGKVRIPTY